VCLENTEINQKTENGSEMKTRKKNHHSFKKTIIKKRIVEFFACCQQQWNIISAPSIFPACCS
jgi:hypothetical protein